MAVITMPTWRPQVVRAAGDACVIIPARGGSKGVPRKNLRSIGGEPLVARAVRTVRGVDGVDGAVVSTDDPQIARAARSVGASVVKRSAWLSGDDASSESALLFTVDDLASRGIRPEVVAFVQATSPFIDGEALTQAIGAVRDGECDVAFSVTSTHTHLWRHDERGPVAVNHDAAVRLRRQDMSPQFRETGAFYVMNTAGFQHAQHRFFGRLRMVEVDAADAMEIDDELDVRLAEDLIEERRMGGTDTADAPLSGGAVVIGVDGLAAAPEHIAATARAHAARLDVPVALLSSRERPTDATGLTTLVARDDATAIAQWARGLGVGLDEVVHLGNDAHSAGGLSRAEWPVVPGDARPDCLKAARHVLRLPGGSGAVGELMSRVRPRSGARTRRRTKERIVTEWVKIGEEIVGREQPAYVIGEIGINHNGDVRIAKELIDVAADAGAQAVKFQKRTPHISTPEDMRHTIRQTPWGEMTYLDYRYRVEFEVDQYTEIAEHAAARGVDWFASPWDVPSVAFLEELGVSCHKVASASVTDLELLSVLCETNKPIILSTGMSTVEQIDRAVETVGTDQLVLMHATSTYPLPPQEANLRALTALQVRYGVPVGYSGHETGLEISCAAVALGAVAVERHITLSREMWGSDQAASLEPRDFRALVSGIRTVETALGDGVKRVMAGEHKLMARLRRHSDPVSAAS